MNGARFRTRGGTTIAAQIRREGSHLFVQTESGSREFVVRRVGTAEFVAQDLVEPQKLHRLHAIRDRAHWWIWLDGRTWRLDAIEPGAGVGARARGDLTAPIPATVQEVLVADGDTVQPDQVLLVLSAMKMQLEIKAPHSGIVVGLALRAGDQVDGGAQLLQIRAANAPR